VNSVDNFLTKILPTGIVSENISAVLQRKTMQQKISTGFFAFSSDFYGAKRGVEESCSALSSRITAGRTLPVASTDSTRQTAAPNCNQTVTSL
jgi:hypothetical protein